MKFDFVHQDIQGDQLSIYEENSKRFKFGLKLVYQLA